MVPGGILFGIAFATRVNAAVVPMALMLYVIMRSLFDFSSLIEAWRWLVVDVLRLLAFGLVGFVVFVILFPPIWSHPLTGFLDFLHQQTSVGGHGSLIDTIAALSRHPGFPQVPSLGCSL